MVTPPGLKAGSQIVTSTGWLSPPTVSTRHSIVAVWVGPTLALVASFPFETAASCVPASSVVPLSTTSTPPYTLTACVVPESASRPSRVTVPPPWTNALPPSTSRPRSAVTLSSVNSCVVPALTWNGRCHPTADVNVMFAAVTLLAPSTQNPVSSVEWRVPADREATTEFLKLSVLP